MSLDINALHDVYIVEFFESLDCPRALTCWLLYTHGEHKQLADLDFNPYFYIDFCHARDSLAATKFLSKATFLKTGNDLEKVALDGFFLAEAICKETNQRIRGSRFENPLTSSILMSMGFKISNILGRIDADEFIDSCNWGPGSTTLLRRSVATHPNKFAVERRITAEAYEFVRPWFHLAYPSWDMMFEINGLSKIVTVPKNAKTDRVIAIEPGINLWFQKGIGAVIRKRLKYNGVDLNDQGVNQKRARLGSLTNRLATVDFSMASDTIAYALVEEILPRDWFGLLRAFRTSSGSVGKDAHHFYKFSSMGNGFTFELESLIFYSLAVACCDYLGVDSIGTSVFGDDVVLPSVVYDLFCEISKDLGFTVNRSKSYSSSDYRESCGSYYWRGTSIKPIYHKVSFDGQLSVVKSANALRLFSYDREYPYCDRRFEQLWTKLVGYLGIKFPRVPRSFGDLGIIDSFDNTADYRTPAMNGYEGYFIKIHAVRAVESDFFGKGLLLSKLKALGSRSELIEVNYLEQFSSRHSGGNSIPLPGQIRYVKKRVLIQQWDEIGPWV